MIARITAGATPRAAGGGEEAVVLWLCEGARGGGGRRQQEVRGLWPEDGKLWAAIGGEEAAVVPRLRSEGGTRHRAAREGGKRSPVGE